MKKWLLLLLLLLTACTAKAEDLSIAVASDLHYLSFELVENRDTLLSVVGATDSKLTHYSREITQTFVEEVLALQPDAVILCGDLTLNGSYESHAELTERLRTLQAAGITVLALPGNHDATGVAYRFADAGVEQIDGMTPEAFFDAYAAFGYADARSRDTVSFSYTYALSDRLWVMMLDVNLNGQIGSLRAETLAWMECELQAAQAAGAQVISVTHQSMLVHHAMFVYGYRITNAEAALALMRQYGVRLNLSGHMHVQHIAEEEGVTDIATSALPVAPCQYAVMTVAADGAIHYETRAVDVAAWAERQGSTDEHLLDFAAYAQEFFDYGTRASQALRVAQSGAPLPVRAEMLNYAVAMNRCMFSGRWTELPEGEGSALWQQYLPDAFFTRYMTTIAEGRLIDMCRFDLPPFGENH